jgi:hypothetical protein
LIWSKLKLKKLDCFIFSLIRIEIDVCIKFSRSFFFLEKSNQIYNSLVSPIFSSKLLNANSTKYENSIVDDFFVWILKKIFLFLDKANTSPSFYFFSFFHQSQFFSVSLCYSPLRLRPVPRVCCVRRRRQPQQIETYGRSYVGKKEREKKAKRTTKQLITLYKRWWKGAFIMGNWRTYIYMPAYPVRSTCSIKSAHQKKAVDTISLSLVLSAGALTRD